MTIPTEVAAVLAEMRGEKLTDRAQLSSYVRVWANRIESALTAKAEAVAWQSRYRYPLPNGGSAEWQEITKTQFEDREALPGHEKRALYAHAPPDVPVASVPDHRIADLLHLLQFATITTPTETDAEQAQRIMREMRSAIAAAPEPIPPTNQEGAAP